MFYVRQFGSLFLFRYFDLVRVFRKFERITVPICYNFKIICFCLHLYYLKTNKIQNSYCLIFFSKSKEFNDSNYEIDCKNNNLNDINNDSDQENTAVTFNLKPMTLEIENKI